MIEKFENINAAFRTIDTLLGGLGMLASAFIVLWVLLVVPGMVILFLLYYFGVLT
ncbi:MAG: hypothetical protein ACNA7J_06285 [Wenzhouxiangella sp.]